MRTTENGPADRILNVSLLVVGTWLLAAPWVAGFSAAGAAAANSWACGALLVALGGAAFARPHDWEEWIALAIGVWLVASPPLLGFGADVPAAWSHIGAGTATVIVSVIELWRLQISTQGRSL